jgi:hypothetical protein
LNLIATFCQSRTSYWIGHDPLQKKLDDAAWGTASREPLHGEGHSTYLFCFILPVFSAMAFLTNQ